VAANVVRMLGRFACRNSPVLRSVPDLHGWHAGPRGV